MNISDFEIGKIYRRDDLISAFKGAFQGGINICKRTNTIVITSLHTDNRIYEDRMFDGEIMQYTGEGQVGDQRLIRGNKAIAEAKEINRPIHLFIRMKPSEYTYYGIVELVGEPVYVDEKDINGNMRKVIKFPMVRSAAIRRMTDYETSHIFVRGVTPMEKPTLNVVGAAIINDNNQVLCAQRGHGSLIGKWEFPGGKVKKNESDTDALKREIKEELDIDIEVDELIDESFTETKEYKINLKVYKCKYLSGTIHNTEHQTLKWAKPEELESLDWTEADKPIMESYLDSLPIDIEGEPIKFDYFEAKPLKENPEDIERAVEDYEKTNRRRQRAGNRAEEAVLRYEREKLYELGRPDLADKVEWKAKSSSSLGYDILSFEQNDEGFFIETHIEVKSATLTSSYITFFISRNELVKYRERTNHKVYCLFKQGRSYKIHIVNKDAFFSNDCLRPMSYLVKIRIAE